MTVHETIERWAEFQHGTPHLQALLGRHARAVDELARALFTAYATPPSFFDRASAGYHVTVVAHSIAGLGPRHPGNMYAAYLGSSLLRPPQTRPPEATSALRNTYVDLTDVDLSTKADALVRREVLPALARENSLTGRTFDDDVRVWVLKAGTPREIQDCITAVPEQSPYAPRDWRAWEKRMDAGSAQLLAAGSIPLEEAHGWVQHFPGEPPVMLLQAPTVMRLFSLREGWKSPGLRASDRAAVLHGLMSLLRHESVHLLDGFDPGLHNGLREAVAEALSDGRSYEHLLVTLDDADWITGSSWRSLVPAYLSDPASFFMALIEQYGYSGALDILALPKQMPKPGPWGNTFLDSGGYDGLAHRLVQQEVAAGRHEVLGARLQRRSVVRREMLAASPFDHDLVARARAGLHTLDDLTRQLEYRPRDVQLQRRAGRWHLVPAHRRHGPAPARPSRAAGRAVQAVRPGAAR